MSWTQTGEMQDDSRYIMLCMERLWVRDMVCDSPLEVPGLTPKEAGNSRGNCWLRDAQKNLIYSN